MPDPTRRSAPSMNVLDAFNRHFVSDEDALVTEMRALRQDIAQLLAQLAPVPSLILTGREVLDEFKKIAHTNKGIS